MADTWQAIPGYASNNYSDTMVFEVDGATKKLQKISGQTLIAGEKNSQYIRFMMPRYWDGIDVSEKSISIIYGLAGQYYGETAAISAERTDDSLRFGWVVPEEACCIAGTLLFVLVIKDSTYVLKTQIAETPVQRSINLDEVIPEPTKELWYKDFQVRIEQTLSNAENAVNEAQNVLNKARALIGAPLVANTAEGMTDTSRIYVYTGSEAGYTSGHWYYYDGSAWTDGGVYNAVAVDTDTTLTIAGKAADAKETGDQLTGLKENLNAKIDTITDGLDVTASGKTSLYLNTGDTAIIDVKSITGTVNTYIDGHSSENVLALNAVTKVEYTAVSSGYLKFYFIPNATMNAHVTLKNALGQNVEGLINSVSILEDASLKQYDVVLESGDFDTTDGSKITNAKRLRTSNKISKDIEKVLFSSEYYAYMYAYDTSGTYIGSYTGNGFSKNWQDKMRIFSPVDMRDFESYNYQFAFTFARLDNATSLESSLDLLPISGIAKNIAKELTAIKDIPLEYGTLDTTSGANYASQNALRTPTYINNYATKITFSNCKARFFAYTQDGVFVGGYGTEGYTKDYSKYVRFDSPVYLNDLGGENYFFRVVFDQFTGDVTKENADAEYSIDVLAELKNTIPEEYTVGGGGDFATFTEMLIALENNTNEKIVYVQGGTYDIFEEMGGAEYMASLTDASSLNWRDVCHVVPWNTTIIGVGDVVLAWNPTDAEIIDQDHAFLFSPLNVSGTCKIKNIKIECSNARYGIHDETSGRAVFNGAVHEFENVSVIYSASTYGIKYAYGAGHNKNMKFKFKNCLFSAPIYAPWSSHDWPSTASENSTFEFDNCIFLNTHDVASGNAGSIRFESADTTGRLDDVKINACVFDTVIFSAGSAVKQGYVVTTTLCKAYTPTYSSYIAEADRIAPKDYLILP